MKIKKLTVDSNGFPEVLRRIPQPPKELFVLGADINDLLARPAVTIVGSRKVSAYGKSITSQLAGELAAAGVVIISGLALGVDALAHRAALEADGTTIAVLPAGLDKVYPSSHLQLAQQILEQGGALVSEYPPGMPPQKQHFIVRNRIASGLSNGLLITEAAEKSGSLHTARFALEQGKEVMAVPGNITSPTSVGTNNLIKSGATPITDATEVLQALGLELQLSNPQRHHSDNPHEQALLALLQQGISDGTALLEQSKLEVTQFNQALTMLEIKGVVRALGSNQWRLH